MFKNIDPSKLTPMMKQYYDIKRNYLDSILLFRLGDFYEMFFDDAITASKELEIVLTARDCGLDEKAPMAGIPHHTADPYISKLVEKGYRVAICEQMEDPAQAVGIVKRGVTRLVSPGMNLDSKNTRSHNYLLSIYMGKSILGFAYIDVSTGDLILGEESLAKKSSIQIIQDQIAKIKPSEIIINTIDDKDLNSYLSKLGSIFISRYEAQPTSPDKLVQGLSRYFSKKTLKNFRDKNFALTSLSALIDYVYSYEKSKLSHFKDPVYIESNNYMQLDSEARINLDISRSKDHNNSLTDLLDKAVTPMGSRLIESSLENPFMDEADIDFRLNLVEGFLKDPNLMTKTRSLLEGIYDIERILGKLSYSRANARDLNALKNSIEPLTNVKSLLISSTNPNINDLAEKIDTLKDFYDLINSAIVDDPPISLTEGGIIKEGFSEDLDKIRNTSILGLERLEEYELAQKEKTGIKNLKIVHNKNTGYFLDITKSNLDKVPIDYHRVQTLTNSERFITNELKEIENMIFTSADDTEKMEYRIFNELRENITGQAGRIQEICQIIALVDLVSSFAYLAKNNNYVRPKFHKSKDLDIENGRHPMIEDYIGGLSFIPNDINFSEDNLIQIITGPNMSGKSTYLRQTALIIIMAQIGSFVPADKANLPIVDKVFTRIGSSDNIIHGDSTFMVEMKEMANIINNATDRSLLLLDEVGRGTSTYDGLSIAWAVLEHISANIKSKTLFATHYQELVVLSDRLDNVENYSIKVQEDKNGIVFLYKIEKGSTSKSFGIEVAKLSGLPKSIIKRARTILSAIESSSSFSVNQEKLDQQIDFLSLQKDSFINEISKIDVNALSPIDALYELNSLIENAKMLGE